MHITYLFGPHHSGKSAYLTTRLAEALLDGKEAVCLFPSIEHVHYQKRQMAQRLGGLPPGKSFWGTFLAFAHYLLTYHKRFFKTLDKAEEWLKIYLLLRQQLSENECQPGRITLLQQLFSEWRESSLSSNELQSLFGSQEKNYLQIYINVYAQLQHDCQVLNRGNSTDLLLQAVEILKDTSLYHGDILSIDGFYEFNPLQLKLLQTVIPRFDTIYITCDHQATHPVYRYGQNFPLLFGEGEILEFAPSNHNYFTQIQSELFSNPLPLFLETLPQPTHWVNRWVETKLKIVRCPNRRSEVEIAARTIKRWVNDGLELAQIGVVFRQESCYRPLIEHIFPQFGLPLPPSPPQLFATEPAQMLLRILEINQKNFARHLLLDLLRLPAFPRYYSQEIINSFESSSTEIGIAFSPTTWLKRFSDQLSYLQWSLTQPEEEDKHPVSQHQIDQTQKLISFLENLFPAITLPPKMTLPQLYEKINAVWNQYRLPDTDYNVIRQINSLFNDLIRLAPNDLEFNLTELATFFQKALNRPLLFSIPQAGELFVGELMAARGHYFAGLIVLGLVDGEFPARHTLNPLFNQAIRQAGNARLSQPLFRTEANLLEEKYLFHLLIGRTNRYLLVTYPEMDSDNKELPTSPFVTELLATTANSQATEQSLSCYEYLPSEEIFTPLENAAAVEDLLNLHFAQRKNITNIEQYVAPQVLNSIERQLAIQQQRHQITPSEYLGVIADEDWQYPSSQNEISLTKLEAYLRCPFYYLCAHFWRVPTIEEPTLELDSRLVGILIHKVLEALVQPFLGQPAAWEQFLFSPPADWQEQIKAILNAERARLNFISQPLWQQLENQIIDGVGKFIEAERQELENGFFPAELEKVIKVSNAPFCAVSQAPFTSFTLTGKIDRIDLNPATQQYLVLDYKRTGSYTKKIIDDAKDKRLIQIPLYLIALPYGDPKYQAYSVGGGSYYSFEDGKRGKGFSLEKDDKTTTEEWEKTVQIVTTTVKSTLQDIVRGIFTLKPSYPDKTCGPLKCEYYDLCRYERSFSPESTEEEGGE